MEHHVATAQEDVAARPDALIYRVERPVYDEGHVRSQLLHCRERRRPTLRQRLARHVQCSTERAKAAVLSFLPILAWLPSYPLKRYLFGDVVSGLSTGIMQLPQGMAYAMLAAVPPVYGLYSSFYPVLLYTFFGTSRHISMGTFAVISLMIGGVVVREAPDSMFCIQEAANGTCAVLGVEARDAARVQLAVALTALVGIIQLVLGLLRFGFVAVYLAEPLVRGFTTAAAVHVFVSQLKYLLGVEAPRFAGPFSALRSVAAVFGDIASTNVTALAVGLTCIVLLYGVKDVNERLKKTLPVPIPGEMIIVIVTTGISYGVGLSDNYGVDVVGRIPVGLLPPAVPHLTLLPNLVTDSFAIAIVGFSMDISLAKIFALKHGYSVDGNQELIALGLCNFIGCFFQTFAVTCSMSRSLVQESTGGNTQIAGLLASLVVLLVVVAVGFIFEPLPQTVLAAIIMVNLLGMFKQIRDVPALWRTSKIELAIWLVAFVASVLLGLDYGLLVAVGFALSTVIYRTQSPKSAILGQVTDTGLYCDVAKYEEAAECSGIKIFHSNSSIYFANSELYVNDLKEKTGVHPTHLQAVRRDLKKRNHIGDSPQEKDAEVKLEMDAGVEGHENGQVTETCAESDPKEDHRFPEPLTASIHSIILDWTPVNFMDSVGAKSIRNVIREYAGVGVQVFIAGCSRTLLSELGTLQFFSGAVTPEMVFPTVHDAVLHSQQRTRPDANHCIV